MDPSDDEQLELDDEQYSSFPDFQHLNIDLCWELIFPFLDVNDLGNVADTCRQMRRAAEITFAQKYGKMCFYITTMGTFNFFSGTFKCDTYHNGIILCDSKICYQMLRCFGSVISKLRLVHGCIECTTDSFWTHCDEYVTKYCAEYIKELEISNRKHNFQSLQISFPNIEKVLLTNCVLPKSFAKFNERFPKMRSLILARDHYLGTTIDDQSGILEHYPHLEHLSIYTGNLFRQFKSAFDEETVLSLLELNPNVRSLNLCSQSYWQEEFLQAISKICKSLDVLKTTGFPLNFDGRVHFKSVKIFRIDHWGSSFHKPVPLTFDALEMFKLNSYSPLRSSIFDFVRYNPTMTKLCLRLSADSRNTFTHDKIIEMKHSFAFIKELEIEYSGVSTFTSAEKITVFLDNCASLERFVLKSTDESGYYLLINLAKSLQNVAVTIDYKKKIIICQ